MRVAYYCQHVLGVGHFHRSLEICRAISKNHKATMILGGPKVEMNEPAISFFQLPGLEMDENFKNLRPCDSHFTLETVKHTRANLLDNFIATYKPDIFIIELYPFGRKAFRFELDPVLTRIQNGKLPPCKIFCSLRDILVERDDQQKFEKRVINTFNAHFDGLLIHADEMLMPLETTFSKVCDLIPPIKYTGYVTPKSPAGSREKKRNELKISSTDKLILVSLGGGNVGHELIEASLDAFHLLDTHKYFLKVFTGPYTDQKTFEQIIQRTHPRIEIKRFSHNFNQWLAAADLSISMAGYNTCMNILAEGTPALLYPFAQNQEQRMRVTQLLQQKELHLLSPEELKPVELAALITTFSHSQRFTSTINLEGAANTAGLLSEW